MIKEINWPFFLNFNFFLNSNIGKIAFQKIILKYRWYLISIENYCCTFFEKNSLFILPLVEKLTNFSSPIGKLSVEHTCNHKWFFFLEGPLYPWKLLPNPFLIKKKNSFVYSLFFFSWRLFVNGVWILKRPSVRI